MRLFASSLLALTVAGCPTSTSVDAPSPADTPAIDTPTLDAPAPDDAPLSDDASDAFVLPDGGLVAACAYVDTIDRSCTTDDDCLVVLHQTDCCGSSVMLGIHTSARSLYEASEPACMASYPGCGCPATLPTTDSGETVTDTSLVRAACVSRGPRSVCLTYVTMRPPEGA